MSSIPGSIAADVAFATAAAIAKAAVEITVPQVRGRMLTEARQWDTAGKAADGEDVVVMLAGSLVPGMIVVLDGCDWRYRRLAQGGSMECEVLDWEDAQRAGLRSNTTYIPVGPATPIAVKVA